MNRNNITIFKLTHTYFTEEDAFFIQTHLPESELLKLIKSLQILSSNIEETFDLFPSEMKDILLTFDGISLYPDAEDLSGLSNVSDDAVSYIELDLYLIWEAINITASDEDLQNANQNLGALNLINSFISEELSKRNK
jgi:hypothetical protein